MSYTIIREKLFLLTYIFYMVSMIICNSAYAAYLPSSTGKGINIICILILSAGEIINHKYTIKQIVILLILLLLTIVNYIITNDASFVLTLTFIYCSHDISIKRIVKCTWIVLAIMLLIIVVSSKIGLITNYIVGGFPRERECIGFLYPLVPATLFSNLMFSYAIYKKWSISWISMMFFLLINGLILYLTDSRLGAILTFVFLLTIIGCKLLKKYQFKSMMIKWIMIFSYVIFCFWGIYFSYNYNPSDIYYLLANIILSGRLQLGYDALTTYPVSMFGVKLPLVGNGLDANGMQTTDKEYFWIDCVYIKLLLQYGLVILSAYILAFTELLRKYSKKNDFIMMLVLALMGLHGLIDDAIMYVMYNPFLLLIGSKLMSVKDN